MVYIYRYMGWVGVRIRAVLDCLTFRVRRTTEVRGRVRVSVRVKA